MKKRVLGDPMDSVEKRRETAVRPASGAAWKRLTTGLVAVAAAAATLIMPATTAATASETRVVGAQGVYYYTGSDVRARAWGDCRDGWTCFFTEYDGGGAMWRVPSCGRHVVPAAFNDQLTSGWNRTPTTIDLYLNSNFTGFMGGVPGHWQGQLAPSDNDRTSSVDARC